MPCLFVVIALVIPRGVIVALWLLTDWFAGVFDTMLWPVLGFIFLPTTLLWYSAVHNWYGGQWGLWQIVGLIVALLIDTSPGHRRRREV
ncbi:MAG TPA: hypothetical protein VFZ24_10720 [Longimicrobiales bacterium]